ncbi:unnamed protein product [Arctogadus glacialis]
MAGDYSSHLYRSIKADVLWKGSPAGGVISAQQLMVKARSLKALEGRALRGNQEPRGLFVALPLVGRFSQQPLSAASLSSPHLLPPTRTQAPT